MGQTLTSKMSSANIWLICLCIAGLWANGLGLSSNGAVMVRLFGVGAWRSEGVEWREGRKFSLKKYPKIMSKHPTNFLGNLYIKISHGQIFEHLYIKIGHPQFLNTLYGPP
jgi:hypothetical protein